MATKKKATTTSTADLDALMREDQAKQAPPPDKLEAITTTARELWKLDERLGNIAKEAADLTAERRRLAETVLPTLMDEAQLTALKLADNVTLERLEDVHASISRDNTAAAQEWMTKNGYGALLTFGFTIPLEKGDVKLEKKIKAVLKREKIGFNETCSVHPQTLKAFVRESIDVGRTLPPAISVHIQPVVKIKLAKTKGAK